MNSEYRKLKKKKKKLISLMLTLIMCMQVMMPAFFSYADGETGSDVKNLLKDLTATVSQDGKEISEGGTLASGKDVSVNVSFGVPVKGDGLTENFVSRGDFAEFQLAKGFTLVGNNYSFELTHNDEDSGNIKIGTLTISPSTLADGDASSDSDVGIGAGVLTARVVFDGAEEIFNPDKITDGGSPWSNVTCEFSCQMKYAGGDGGDASGDHGVIILEKNYKVNVPEPETEVSGTKTGTVNGKYIDWLVTVSAQQAGKAVSLEGYTFTDNLENVGTYVPESFKVSDTAPVSGSESGGNQGGQGNTGEPVADGSTDDSPVTEVDRLTVEGTTESGQTLKYTFPACNVNENAELYTQYVSFRTEIDDKTYYSNAGSAVTINNTAKITKDNNVVASMRGEVSFTSSLIKKEAGTVEYKNVEGQIRPTITWTITANTMGAYLKNAVITDELDSRMIWESAEYSVYKDNTWKVVTDGWTVSPEKTEEENPREYHLGNIRTPVMLKITAYLNSEKDTDGKPKYDFQHTIQTINNKATLTWENHNVGSSEVISNIGLNPISKTAGTYDPATMQIPWTVNIEASDVHLNLRTLDLLVYGSSGFIIGNNNYIIEPQTSETPSVSEGNGVANSKLNEVSIDDLKTYINNKGVTPRYNQKYVEGSFSPADADEEKLTLTVYTVKDSTGTAVADLLVVTGKDESTGIDLPAKTVQGTDSGQSTSGKASISYTFKTQVTNPEIYLCNGSKDVHNTVSLFSANAWVNSAEDKATVKSKVIDKDVLSVENAKNYYSAVEAADVADVWKSDNSNESLQKAELDAVNASAGGANNSFDYVDKSVLFRFHVNQNGISGIQGLPLYGSTASAGSQTGESDALQSAMLGSVVVSDTLPEGWQYENISGNLPFLVYEATSDGTAPVKVKATKRITDYKDLLTYKISNVKNDTTGLTTGTLTITFNDMSKPYLIVVKASPSEEACQAYFSKNENTPIRNTANLSTENWTNQVGDYEDVTIKSQIIEKNAGKLTGNGEVKWTVEYKPCDVNMANVAETGSDSDSDNGTDAGQSMNSEKSFYIVDNIPEGAELRINSDGSLNLSEGNIKITELNLKSDGTYEDGDPVTPVEVTADNPDGNVSYDSLTRELKFPISDSSQAYRFEYVTDIFASGGISISNTAKLIWDKEAAPTHSAMYQVSSADASASMTRSGYIKITKADNSEKPMSNVEFHLINADGNVLRAGKTDASGKLSLYGIPVGEYTLVETVPDGYTAVGALHTVSITGSGSKITTAIDGDVVSGNTIKLVNYKIPDGDGAGSLKISKLLSGNATDSSKSFDFTVTLKNNENTVISGKFQYAGEGGKQNGTLEFEQGQAKISLKGGESITIKGLAPGFKYTVVEDDYSSEGYSKTENGCTGDIEAGKTSQATVTNTKRRSSGSSDSGNTQIPVNPGTTTPENPEDSQNPTNPSDPITPNNPDDSETPINPDDSTNPKDPDNPDNVTPNQPIVPAEPQAPSDIHGNPPYEVSPEDQDLPRFEYDRTPDPQDASSPEELIIIDEDGVPLAKLHKETGEDGNLIYIDENGIPLSTWIEDLNSIKVVSDKTDTDMNSGIPKTDDVSQLRWLLTAAAVCLICGTVLMFVRRRYMKRH